MSKSWVNEQLKRNNEQLKRNEEEMKKCNCLENFLWWTTVVLIGVSMIWLLCCAVSELFRASVSDIVYDNLKNREFASQLDLNSLDRKVEFYSRIEEAGHDDQNRKLRALAIKNKSCFIGSDLVDSSKCSQGVTFYAN